MLRPHIVAVGGLMLGLGPVAIGRADERAFERFDVSDGLPTSAISAVAQDDAGFLWIGTVGGLARFDGETIVRVATDEIRGWVHRIVPAGDRVFVAEHWGELWVVERDQVTPVAGPDGATVFGATDVLVDDDELWIAVDGALKRRGPDGEWSSGWSACFEGDPVRQLAMASAGPLHIATDHAVWRARADPDACPEKLAEAHAACDVLVTDEGDVHVLELHGRWWRLRGTTRELLHERIGRAQSLAMRGPDVWAAYTDTLAVARPGRAIEVSTREDVKGRAGPLTVDHEGSLWVATVDGLLQYAEPDTITYSLHADGIPLGVLRLVDAGDVLLTTSWNGSAVLEDPGGAPRLGRLGEESRFEARFVDSPCRDEHGMVWAAGYVADGYIVWDDVQWSLRPTPSDVRVHVCTTTPDEQVLLATAGGIHRIVADTPTWLADLPWGDGRTIQTIFEDHTGRVWLTAGREVCSRNSFGDAGWSCEEMPRRVAHLVGMVEDSGVHWAATATDGLYARVSGGWERLPGSDRLPSQALRSPRRSPRGGVWVMGSGFAMRVQPSPAHPDGFVIVERLSRRHGIVNAGADDILERPDGELWVAGAAGITRIPAHVRSRDLQPPRLELVAARLDGERVAIDEVADLPPEPGMIELEIAALSFVERDRLRFSVQLTPEGAWSEPFARPSFQLYNPPAGAYEIRVAASLDGERWTVARDLVRLQVAAPVHQRLWFWALVALAIAGAAYGLHRARMAVHRRLAQQRLRIAMDLHDDLGSGLGSIGLVADLLSRPEVPTKDKLQLAGEISSTASELGDSLRGLVWTLRDERDSLESLAVQLSDRAATLVPGDHPRLSTAFPEQWPSIDLSLPVRRNLQLIAGEALYNAVRHARARGVTLGLGVLADGRCTMWVEDDGIGGVDPKGSGNGMGLRNLRRRADEIGATLRVGPGARGRGTRVEIVFLPRAADRRVTRRGFATGRRE